MDRLARYSRIAAAASALVAAACSESLPTQPEIGAPGIGNPVERSLALADCTVDVRAATLACTDARSVPQSNGVRASILLGSQDVFVRLTSSGTAYDESSDVFRSDLVVQNLIKQMIGTTDGVSASGVKVFFHTAPTVTSGTGAVTLINADGVDTFTGAGQAYYNYAEILEPYQLSQSKEWKFDVPGTVNTFAFQLLISTDVPDESLSYLDKVWTGAAGTAWENASNWNTAVPDSLSTVAVPPAALLTSGNQPVLAASTVVENLRVGAGSSLDLGANLLRVWGNLDLPGMITNGSVRLTGADTYLGGSLDKLEVAGSVVLQRAVKATGPVSVTGTLAVKNQTLTIALP
ncbi:MAG TPA: hypothetical protein VF042_06050 [Gemmatimonadaceae bacterium]